MTPAEHYVEAERLLAEVAESMIGPNAPIYLKLARVHAILACAPAPPGPQTLLGKTLEQWHAETLRIDPRQAAKTAALIRSLMVSTWFDQSQSRFVQEVLALLEERPT
jgi:hypothetical protein